MKLLTILIASLLSAEVTITKYPVVNFHNRSLKNVTIEVNNKTGTERLFYLGSFELDNYELVKCNKKEGYCLIEKDPIKGEKYE